MEYALQQGLNALSVGGEYALLALGLAIVFSVMGLVNFAHGEFITVGGYGMFLIAIFAITNPLFVLPVGVLSAVAAALVLERIAFRPVRNAPATTGLLTAFGVSVIIQNAFLIFVGTRPKAVGTASWMTDTLLLGTIQVPMVQVLETIVTIVAISLLMLLLKKTNIGLAMRAAAKDIKTVRLMGIQANKVVAIAFALSGLLAGIAAVFILSRRGAVDPFMGFVPVLKAFVAAVLGGFGSLLGAVVGGFVLGIAEVAVQAMLSHEIAAFRDAIVFLLVGLLLVLRPQGIIGHRIEFGEK